MSDSSADIEKFYSNYGDDRNEYLMDGAILTCNMATIKSYEKGKHILPFECNCAYLPDRDWELEEIFSDIEKCKKLGTCQKLMKLENDWGNIIKETDYESFETEEGEQAEVITMMSVLFCSHGGLITPVTSGQVNSM